jgi:Tfp pilus assembly protein PilV
MLEALVAMLVLAFGMLAIGSFQVTLSRNADIAKQRSEATRLAQRQIDMLRSFGQRGADGTPGGTQLTYVEDVVTPTPAYYDVTGSTTNTSFRVTTTVTPTVITATPPTGDRYRWVHVQVAWADRTGTAQQVVLSTSISDGDPADLGVLGVGRGRSSTLRPKNRNINIPYPAVTLSGGQRSAFIPPPGNIIFAFDNTTGDVVQRCTGLSSLTEGIDLAAAGATCVDVNGYLLSGYVRFKTSGAAPNASNIDDPSDLTDTTLPLMATNLVPVPAVNPLIIDAASTGNAPTAYECYSQRQLTVRNNSTQQELNIAEGASVPTGYSASGAPRFIAYTCIITPTDHDSNTATRALWSGEVRLNPNTDSAAGTPWTIGTGSGQYKVCRFSSDYNRNTTLSNHEHPRYYREVTGAVDNQNYLVINGGDSCPPDVASNPLAGDYLDTNTAGHQPSSVAELSFRCANAACSGANKIVMEPATATTAIPME